ncbi:MAG: hypothetical protein ACQERE_02840 [Pseudomonadota bacterium]
MTRYFLRAGLVLLTLTALAGCLGDSDSDEFGEDIDEFEASPESDEYRARVLNGELESAFVWLDMDGDGEFSTYTDEDYRDDFVADEEDEQRLGIGDNFEIKEPWGVTDANGNVMIDTESFDLPATVAPDLDPDDFPLMAVGIPGVTVNDGETIEKAFFLSAPPGVTNVTPFSTMAETVRRIEIDRGNEADLASAGTTLLQEEVLGSQERIGPYQDYLRNQGQAAVPFYATAIRRLIQAQVPEGVSSTVANDLRNLESRPDEKPYFAPGDMRVIGSLLLDQAANVIREVGEDIEARGLDGYTLPPDSELETVADFEPDLNNPYVAVEQRYFIPEKDLEDAAEFEPVAPAANGRLSAQVFLDYDLGVRLRRMDVRGQTRPSMGVFPFLVDAGGKPTDLGYMPFLDIDTDEVAGDPVKRDELSEGDLDERFIGEEGDAIDWETPRIGLDSSWFEAGGADSEVGGSLERVYEQPASGSGFDLVRYGQDGSEDAQVGITPDSGARRIPVNLWLSDDWTSNSELSIDYGSITALSDCGDTIQHVNAEQEVTLNRVDGESITITRYGHHRDNPSDGEVAFRVMVETYDNPSGNPFRREYQYFSDGIGTQPEIDESLKKADQPDLLRSVRVLRSDVEVTEATFCGSDNEPFSVESSPDNMRLYVGFDYMRFADYLESIGTRD